MSHDLNNAAHAFCARWAGKPVGFSAVLPQPGVKEKGKSATDRGRINVNLDGDVKAVKRENVVPVPSAGVGRAPSSAAMAWLTPGFLSFVSPGGYRTDETCGIYPWGWS